MWLRFAQEMNWYSRDGEGPGTLGGISNLTNAYTGTSSEFIHAWNTLSRAVDNNSMVKMFWSPNAGDDHLDQWWPGPASVDIVGLDAYPSD